MVVGGRKLEEHGGVTGVRRPVRELWLKGKSRGAVWERGSCILLKRGRLSFCQGKKKATAALPNEDLPSEHSEDEEPPKKGKYLLDLFEIPEGEKKVKARKRCLPCSAVLAMAVFALFSGACHGGLCPVQRCLPCSEGLDFAVSDLCSGVCHGGPSLPSGAVAAGALLGTDSGGGLRTSDDCAALQGTDSGGGLRTSDDCAALQGTDSGGGLWTSDDCAALLGTDLWTSDDCAALLGTDSGGSLRTSDDCAALLGTDSGDGLRTSDDGAGGGVLGSGEDGGLLCGAALPRLWQLLLPVPHLGRSHS
ncbi:hypothetical protein NDU88_011554 [Pleurodeles waltl]|uniref:Uncharacterized protein n=1 Tax=Pleurodeles waltl TaxID=8319 RepID=A0AAV7S255_PLEWA|nr:hypothetical protein NDU88_011554 [Pleurodeles waltl]